MNSNNEVELIQSKINALWFDYLEDLVAKHGFREEGLRSALRHLHEVD